MNQTLALQDLSTGWHGYLKLGFCPGVDRTLLSERQRQGPLSVQRPFYPEGDVCHVYILHPPGGVVGGDKIEQNIRVDLDASALITTPGATKFYRSAGQEAVVTNRLSIDGALEWLPQETIVFDQARLRQQTIIELGQDAKFIGWEMICLGRPASDQLFKEGAAIFSTSVLRNGIPILNERLPIDSAQTLTGPACLRGNFFTATMWVTPSTQNQRDIVISYIRESAEGALLSATLLDDLLVVRYLGEQPGQCRKHFELLWALLRPEVLGRGATPPRIWNT